LKQKRSKSKEKRHISEQTVTMAFRQALSKLSKTIANELHQAKPMLEAVLAPQSCGKTAQKVSATGAFRRTSIVKRSAISSQSQSTITIGFPRKLVQYK
jgi:pantothenate kinase-related protein Tda10